MNKASIIKTFFYNVFLLVIVSNYANANLLSNKWIGNYSYNTSTLFFANEGLLSITSCKDNKCVFNLDTLSGPTVHVCYLEGELEINQNNTAIFNLDDEYVSSRDTNAREGVNCQAKFILSSDGKEILLQPDEGCQSEFRNFCGVRGYFGDKYNKEEEGVKNYQTSFKCENLNTLAEAKICQDATLAGLDITLAELNKKSNNFQSTSLLWINNTRNQCITNECIKMAYLERIHSFYRLTRYKAKKTIDIPYLFVGQWHWSEYVLGLEQQIICNNNTCKLIKKVADENYEAKDLYQGQGNLKIINEQEAELNNIIIKDYQNNKEEICFFQLKLLDKKTLEIKPIGSCNIDDEAFSGEYSNYNRREGYQGSFNCAKASSLTEEAICFNVREDLPFLDLELAKIYSQMKDVDKSIIKEDIIKSQKNWIKERNQCLDDRICIKEKYLERIIHLYALNYIHRIFDTNS